ncbi:MAG: efflux RND transporter periplasmic adaptor subunit [Bacteroidales bacterium]|nr:efflux RND transporter periplasmic adaptor subunit [Candidatus Sodaliphilus limicaballi]
MENVNNNAQAVSKKNKALLAALAVFVVILAAIAILGLVLITPPNEITQGQADCDVVRVSGKLPGRVVKFYVTEGEIVHKGDTLASIYSSTVDAKLFQAKSMQDAAAATSQKAEAGTRSELKAGAYNLWQQAIAAETITQKTYQRMQNLYEQGVISEQKRDEARAAYESASAAVKAAKSQYDMAQNGAQSEDKLAARSMANAAKGSVMEVQSLLEDQFLIAPCDGEVSEIYPHEGELISLGAPVMSLSKLNDMWASFNVREEKLNNLPVGKEITVTIPALDNKEVKMKVYYVHDRGSYAAWSATKAYGQYDSKTFEVRVRPDTRIENFRPGMSVILAE